MKQILKVLVGSRAHGLNTIDSDYDWRAVFITPTSELLRLGERPDETSFILGKEDNAAFEIGKFLLMATKCNPTILEMFKAEPSHDFKDDYDEELFSKYGKELQDLFPYIWDPKLVKDAFVGYGINQRKKFLDDKDIRPAKYACAYLRTLIIAHQLLTTGDFTLKVTDTQWRQTLLKWRGGQYSRGEVIDVCTHWEKSVKSAYEENPINKDRDLEKVNQFLLKVRKESWI